MPLTLIRRPVLIATWALVAGLGTAAQAAAPAWQQPAYDAGLTWHNPKEKTLRPNNVKQLHQVYRQQWGQFYAGKATQSDGVLFLCSNLHGLSALDLASGNAVWSRGGFGGNCTAAALTTGTAFVTASGYVPGDWTNTLTAVDRASGNTQWQVVGPDDEPFPAASYLGFNTATLSQGSLYVTSGRSLVSAYDASTGVLRWRASTGRLNNDAAVASGRVFTSTWGSSPNLLFAHNTTDGTLAWSQPIDSSNSQYPAAAVGGRVFVGSDSGLLRAFNAVSGAPLWEAHHSGYVSAPLVATTDAVVVVTGNRLISAYEARTGTLLWSVSPKGSDVVTSNLVLANGVLSFAAQDFAGTNRVSALDASTGKQVARLDESIVGSYASLSVTGGRVYVTDFSGYLYVYALP